jgi:hypothetical protein
VLGKEGVLAAMRVAVRRSPAPSSTVGEAEAHLSACLMPVIFGSMTKPHRGGSA